MIKLCSDIDDDFHNLLDLDLELINEAISMGYPYSEEQNSKDEIQKDIKIAEQVKDFVMKKLEKE